jgi:hypothetical protein
LRKWAGFIWPWKGPVGGSYEHISELSGSIKGEESLV